MSFAYPGGHDVLHDISLHIVPGSSLALVGENGSGKTTLIKLLTRLYRPTKGRILLDGSDLNDWDAQALRERVDVIFQDFVRYQLTMGENLGVGDTHAFEDTYRWQQAEKEGMADGFISRQSSGYQTQLGRWFKNGQELSGGQWQKVALSRAYMRKDADILVLDEPTAAMDAAAEADAFARFREHCRDKIGNSMHIGVLEDDLDQQAFIEQYLLSADHDVSLFGRASELRRATQEKRFDFFIIDWRLPDGCGMDMVGHLRQNDGWRGPILFITASQDEDDVVKALEQGADDFLAKPLRPKEFLARIAALGRRAGYDTPRPSATCPSDFEINNEEHAISVAGKSVELTEREYRLATLFFSKIGELLTRAHILELVWGIKGNVSTRTVDTHVSRLRRKLELDGHHGLRLRSIYQSGYRMEVCHMVPVERVVN